MRATTTPIRRWLLLALAALAALGAWLAAAAPSALADTFECTGAASGIVGGPLDVPAGASCTLASGTTINGETTIEGSLNAPGHVTFNGEIVATGAGPISISASSINGALTLTGGKGAIDLSGDTVDGPATISGNTGGINITGSSFTDPLMCNGDSPGPTGGGNSYPAPPTGQCANLQPTTPAPAPAPAPSPGPKPKPTPAPKPKPKPRHKHPATNLVGFYLAPQFAHGVLVLRFDCVPRSPGRCSEPVQVVVTDRSARLTHVAKRHIRLAADHRMVWRLHISRAWRRRLARHPGHLTVTADGHRIYSGKLITRR